MLRDAHVEIWISCAPNQPDRKLDILQLAFASFVFRQRATEIPSERKEGGSRSRLRRKLLAHDGQQLRACKPAQFFRRVARKLPSLESGKPQQLLRLFNNRPGYF